MLAVADGDVAMRIAGLMTIAGLWALAGCASVAGRGEFHLTAEQVNGAWGAVLGREMAEFQSMGVDPLPGPQPSFSGAACRWVEPGRKARCRYRVSRGFHRPGRERVWADEEAELFLTDWGWDFGG